MKGCMNTYLLELFFMRAKQPSKFYANLGEPATTKSYLWLYRTGREDITIVLFDYHPIRAGEHPKRFLSGFKGYFQVDGYSGYHQVPDVTLFGCWAMRDESLMKP